MRLSGGRRKWPRMTRDEIIKRARILVIDDGEFPLIVLFKRDGYTIEQWKDVDDLRPLESGEFDLILLDLRGVGREHSADEGFGLLKHIRKYSPAQIVVAYSNADLSLEYQKFFQDADAVLHKTTDYVEYKRTVDSLLERRFSLGFYMDRVGGALGELAPQAPKARKKARAAILSGDTEPLRRYLTNRVEDRVTIDRVIAVTSAGAQIAALWKS
jgi:CheY-like chemotaxis protein